MARKPEKAPSDRAGTQLLVVFVVVIGSFLGTSVFARQASFEIAALSDQLATNVSPSIQVLASIRGSALEVELDLSRLVNAGEATPERLRRVDGSLARLRSAIHDYLRLPLAAGERQVHDQVQQRWARFAESAAYVREHAARGDFAHARGRMTSVDSAAESLVRACMHAIEFDAKHGQALARRIGVLRRRTALIAGGLTITSVVLGVIGAVLLHRQTRRRRGLAEQRARELESRAAELEQFAGRVAHDIRGPLSAAAIALDVLVLREPSEDVANVVARSKRNLARANAITTALLDFARAGAKPDPGARTSPRQVIDDIAEDMRAEAAKQEIELVFGEVPRALVACSEGVYVSLLGNLIRNAIKHMGQAVSRRVVVGVDDDGTMVRTEVTDTGPGIPDSQIPSLFDPYFRGNDTAGREGLGLGLTTVRKLAEGHGGAVGVWSKEGSGSKFWFTLPRAGSLPE
jgi:signal transduction histidine kinase